MSFPVIWCNIILVRKIQHNKKQEKRLNGNESTFITKDYGNYNPVIKKVNGLEQIGFVKEVIISEATTGRRIDVIVAKH